MNEDETRIDNKCLMAIDYEWKFCHECEEDYLLPENQDTCVICSNNLEED